MGCGVSERGDGVSEWGVCANGYRKREERGWSCRTYSSILSVLLTFKLSESFNTPGSPMRFPIRLLLVTVVEEERVKESEFWCGSELS